MKIAFVYYYLSSFVKQDLTILSKRYQVEAANYGVLRDIPKIAASIWRSNLTFSWFASGHSFLAVLISILFRKRSIIVAGGYDVAFVPEINYGQYTLGWQKKMYTDFVLRNADVILAVSEFTKRELLARARPKRVEIVYNAVDTEKFRPEGKKERLVMTIASGKKNIMKLKGIDTFVEAAAHNPDTKFLVLGLSDEDMKSIIARGKPDNIEIRGYVAHEELIGYLQRAKVYCQLSYRESFGMALSEAMACECVPVATERGALPEVVGDTGFYVPYGDPEKTSEAIKKALEASAYLGKKARERIEEMFALEKRERELVRIIEDVS
jgi:glycosyltransferase involved in cell wall biosynthesis